MTDPTKFILLYKNGMVWTVAEISLSNPKPKHRTFIDQKSALVYISLKMDELKEEVKK